MAWKIPKGLADYDAKEIQVYGRGYTDVLQYDRPMREWLPGWFGTLAGSDKLLTMLAAAAVLALLVYAAGMVFGWWKRRWGILLVQGTVVGSFVFWLCTSPLIRYGCVWVYLTTAVVFGGIYDAVMYAKQGNGQKRGQGQKEIRGVGNENGRIWWRTAAWRVVSAAVILLLFYKGFALAREIAGSYVNDYWLIQKDYDNFETYAYELEGVTFYCPVEGDRVGYEAFPSSPAKARIGFAGERMEDGFIPAPESYSEDAVSAWKSLQSAYFSSIIQEKRRR